MHKILIVGEHDGKALNPATAKCVTCAQGIAEADISVVLLGTDTAAVAAQAAALAGVKAVLRVDRPENLHPLAALFAPQLAALAADYSHIFGPSTSFGKDLMPRLAALLGVPQVSDLMAVESAYRFRRPVYAGNAIVTVEADPARKLIATVRVASFQAAPSGGSAAVESKTLNVSLPSHTRYVGAKSGSTDRPDLQTAPNEMQVGQTGKIIAPEMYIAIGISGAIQHLTGIKDARTIVAINKDGEAPIFEVADIGLVADLFQAVPEFEKLLGTS
jgi:electron transfer flavoprotein alpha subunit